MHWMHFLLKIITIEMAHKGNERFYLSNLPPASLTLLDPIWSYILESTAKKVTPERRNNGMNSDVFPIVKESIQVIPSSGLRQIRDKLIQFDYLIYNDWNYLKVEIWSLCECDISSVKSFWITNHRFDPEHLPCFLIRIKMIIWLFV